LKCPKNFARQWRDARGDKFEWVVPHSFRKAVATLLAGESNNDRATMLQLGHSRIATTEEHYIDRPNEAPDLTNVLDKLAPKK
jgi:integrase